MRRTGAKILLPRPHPGQVEVLDDDALYKWLIAGRRWWKTTTATARAVKGALEGQDILWTAPTIDQTRRGWEEIQRSCGGAAKFRISLKEVWFPGAGRVAFRSMEIPDNTRGWTADGLIIDEAAFVIARAYYEILTAVISDTNGWLLAMGTPNGKSWFTDEWEAAFDNPDSSAWQIPTRGAKIVEKEDGTSELVKVPHKLENPNFSWDEFQRRFERSPMRTFRQEWMAEILEDAGGVFRNVTRAATATWQNEAKPGHEYVVGIDWGKFNDFTVFAVIDVTSRELCHIDRFNQIDYTFQVERFMGLYQRFLPHVVIPEANAMGIAIIEQLERKGVRCRPFTMTQPSKKEAVEALSVSIEKGDLHIVPYPSLISELQNYEAIRLPSGLIRYQAPKDEHDDCVVGAMLAWSACDRPLGTFSGVNTGVKEPTKKDEPKSPAIIGAVKSQIADYLRV